MATLKVVQLEDLLPANYRTVADVKNLVQSILQHGLLQNLVAYPSPEIQNKYILLAGHRRYSALSKIRDQGNWKKIPSGVSDDGVPVLIRDESEGNFESIVENEIRQDVPPWHTGLRLQEYVEAGYSQQEIAARVNRSRLWVQHCLNMSKGLSAGAIRKLDKLPFASLTKTQLLNIASIKTSDGQPNEAKQLARIDFYLSEGGRKKGPIPGKKRLKTILQERYDMLSKMVIPEHFQPLIASLLNYLSGRSNRIYWPKIGKLK